MHNESKLGLLAGVAGVVVAAVLVAQKQPVPPTVPAVMQTTSIAPSLAATPTNAGPVAKAPAASTPVASRDRTEVEGKTTSRPSREEDE